jgi:hypothetical protein
VFAPPSHPQLLCAVCRRDKHLPARSYEIDAWKGWWLTGGAELSDGGSACLVVHAAQAAALGHSPGGAGGRPAVPALLVQAAQDVAAVVGEGDPDQTVLSWRHGDLQAGSNNNTFDF